MIFKMLGMPKKEEERERQRERERETERERDRERERLNLPKPAHVSSTFSLERHLKLSVAEDFCTRFPLTGTELFLNLKTRKCHR